MLYEERTSLRVSTRVSLSVDRDLWFQDTVEPRHEPLDRVVLEIDADEILTGEEWSDEHTRHIEPEEHLWQSVLIQSLVDATLPEDNVYRRQARACLDTEVGVTSEHVDEMCLRAGWDPDYFRSAYKRLRKNNIRLMRKE